MTVCRDESLIFDTVPFEFSTVILFLINHRMHDEKRQSIDNRECLGK
jgi:hypothetical protein